MPLTINQALQQAIDHHNRGRLADAEKLYRLILQQLPDQPEVLRLLGTLLLHSGNFSEAEKILRQALQKSPDNAELHHHLGVALSAARNFQDAALSLQTAHQLAPHDPAIAGNLGIALCHLKRYAEGAQFLQQALAHDPQNADFHAALANALLRLGQLEPALAACNHALTLDTRHAHAHQTLSQLYTAHGNFPAALDEAQRAADLLPNDPDLQLTLGNCFEKRGQLDNAANTFQKALTQNPNPATAAALHNNLANVFKHQALVERALDHHQQAIAADPTSAEYHSNFLFSLQFSTWPPEKIFAHHHEFNRRHALPLAPKNLATSTDHSPNRRLRIGYVSMQFLAGWHLYSLLAHHDRTQFEIFLYSNTAYPDAHTDRFRQHAHHFHDIRHLDDAQLADLIRQHHIDILIDTSLHMGGNRLLAFARKPAPLQISFFGYPGTTGLTAIDYRITDQHLEPPPGAPHGNAVVDAPSSEKILRLPHTFWCYHPQSTLPINPLPALSKNGGGITFGNLNNFCKINEPTLTLWAQIIQQVPNSRLIMMTPEGSHRTRTKNFLAEKNITPDRIDFIPFLPFEQYLRTYHTIDLGLDSFPYNGHTTSLDAFYMGVPVLTIIGKGGGTPVSRAGYSQLLNLNLPDLASPTPEAFIQNAVNLAHNLPRLSQLRQSLRPTMQSSPLMNPTLYAKYIERLYQEVWSKAFSPLSP